jgi:phosphatidylglycerol:prolipoprotein diacylglycerol transferase
LIYGNRKRINWWSTLDALTLFWGVIWITIGISNLASGNAFGAETTLPWGIYLWGAIRHPTQLYQIMAGCIILGMIWPRTANSNVVQRSPGVTFLYFLALTAGAWLLIEGFRADSVVLPNGIRVGQIAAWLILAGSMLGIKRLNHRLPT